MTFFEKSTLVTNSVTALAAIFFAFWQSRINQRLKDLSDFVALAIVPNPQDGNIKLLNTGKINLYIHGFELGDKANLFKEGRLLSAAALDSAFYWIPLNNIPEEGLFDIKIYLSDEFGKKYITRGQGQSARVSNDKIQITVWTHKTEKYNWNFMTDAK